jgi:hypothetical protein
VAVLLLLLLALLGLLSGPDSHRAACPPASGLRDSVCGNLDGKAGEERIGIEIRRGPTAWLVVRLANHSIARRLVSDDTENQAYDAEHQTFVNGLAAVDRSAGLAIVVTVHEGASTAFGQLFRIERGTLRRIPIPAMAGGEFAYEGSVGHFNVIDCARMRSGLIWVSGYGLDGGSHYIEERTLYRLVADRLVPVRHESSRPVFADAGRFREFAEPQPFPHCMVVRGERTH